MILLIYGQDSYHSKKELDAKIQEFTKGNEMQAAFIDGASLDNLQSVQNELLGGSLFSDTKVVVIINMLSENKKNVFKTNYTEWLKKNADGFGAETLLIHYEGTEAIDKRQGLYKFLDKKAEVIEKKEVKGKEKQAGEFVKNFLKEKNLEIELEALNALLTSYQEVNFWQLENDLEKISLYTKARNLKTVDMQAIELCSSQQLSSQIFDLTESLAFQNEDRYLSTLRKLKEQDENEFGVLSLLAYQSRVLMLIFLLQAEYKTESEILQASGLHPFVFHKNKNLVKKFTFESLKKLHNELCEIEAQLKNSEADAWLLMTRLVHSL